MRQFLERTFLKGILKAVKEHDKFIPLKRDFMKKIPKSIYPNSLSGYIYFTIPANLEKAAGSYTAISARIFLSSSMPAFCKPPISLL